MPAPAYKRCSKCREHKPLSDFGRNRSKADGLQLYCNPCMRAARSRYRDAKGAGTDRVCSKCAAHKAAAGFYRMHDSECKQCVRDRAKRWQVENPERTAERRARHELAKGRNPKKERARKMVRRYVEEGRIERPDTCEDCALVIDPTVKPYQLHGHHHDYDKPLDVEWLCVDCHGRRHRDLTEEEELGVGL